MRKSELNHRTADGRTCVPDRADELPARVPPPAGAAVFPVDSRVFSDTRQLRRAVAGIRFYVP